jgi:hypothetical protein
MAGEILASLDDINTHLPSDKASIADADDDPFQTDVARYVRSLLSGFFPSEVLATWTNPDNTPELIRGIAGRLIAAQWYATLYSEDISGVSEYAQGKYNEANNMIDRIRNGSMVVVDTNGIPIVIEGVGLDATVLASTSDPKFTMDMAFG